MCKIHQIAAQFQQCRNPWSHHTSAAPISQEKASAWRLSQTGDVPSEFTEFPSIINYSIIHSNPCSGVFCARSQQPCPAPRVCASTDGAAAAQSCPESGCVGASLDNCKPLEAIPSAPPAVISALAKGTKGKGGGGAFMGFLQQYGSAFARELGHAGTRRDLCPGKECPVVSTFFFPF